MFLTLYSGCTFLYTETFLLFNASYGIFEACGSKLAVILAEMFPALSQIIEQMNKVEAFYSNIEYLT